MWLLAFLACSIVAPKDTADTGGESGDSAETGLPDDTAIESADSAETGDSGDSGDSDSADSDSGEDTGETDTGDTGTAPVDADGDGYDETEDCDDRSADVFPGAEEVCNRRDDDCDGLADDEDDNTLGQLHYWVDVDEDGYGLDGEPILSCEPFIERHAQRDGDCDDANAEVNPGAEDLCNQRDDNCDGVVDDGAATATYYYDADADGYGRTDDAVDACALPTDYAAAAGDCDDVDPTIHPDAAEACNDVDDNCDGNVDESLATVTYYRDADGDGYGQRAQSVDECALPVGYVENGDDCDDADIARNPDAADVCDGVDNNCDGALDESPELAWYADTDGDTYGDPDDVLYTCTQVFGTVDNNGDCDDTLPEVSPAATEACNGADDDCDGVVDEECV